MIINENILSADPYQGALKAFMALDPNATGQDWENWTEDSYYNPKGQFDNFGAFASLCRDGAEVPNLSDADRKLIAHASGVFEAMNLVVSGLRDIMPTSEHVFSHFERYRSNLKRFPERYLDSERDEDI